MHGYKKSYDEGFSNKNGSTVGGHIHSWVKGRGIWSSSLVLLDVSLRWSESNCPPHGEHGYKKIISRFYNFGMIYSLGVESSSSIILLAVDKVECFVLNQTSNRSKNWCIWMVCNGGKGNTQAPRSIINRKINYL
jgi:hypothetical protein